MAGQIPDMLTLILVALICVVMNIAGLELAVNSELDWDREFRAKGFATVISGLGGGTVSTLVVPASLRSKLFGATTRLTGVIAALVIGVALLLGDGMLELVPAPLVGGMLVFAGAGMLDEGMVKSWKRLPRQEYGIILLIFAIIIALGLLEGVGAGIAATLVLFAVRLGRVDSVEARFTLREHQSNKARPVTDHAILLAEGDRVQAYRLRGYIFFGSVVPLADQLRQALSGPFAASLSDAGLRPPFPASTSLRSASSAGSCNEPTLSGFGWFCAGSPSRCASGWSVPCRRPRSPNCWWSRMRTARSSAARTSSSRPGEPT